MVILNSRQCLYNEDVAKVIEGIPQSKVKLEELQTQMQILYISYRCNGVEVERVVRKIMGTDWCLIYGNWNPNPILPCDSEALRKRVNELP